MIGEQRVDPRARGPGADPAAGLPRREVAGGPAALRARRPPRGRRRQHRQLRGGDVRGARSGVVNAGDPAGAYAEAIDMAGAHQSSYGREAAGVFAAAVAAALRPGAHASTTWSRRRSTSRTTAPARRSRTWPPRSAAARDGDEATVRATLRAAVAPYDTVGDEYRAPAMDARRPSRTKSIEELPVALGFVLAHGGDYRAAVLGAVNYGRDADSIATMAGAVCARARAARGVVPAEWVARDRAEASRIDLGAVADHGRAAAEIIAADLAAAEARRERLGRCSSAPRPGRASAAMRLTWAQPEDLLPHELVAGADEGRDVAAVARALAGRGRGRSTPPVSGAAESRRRRAPRARAGSCWTSSTRGRARRPPASPTTGRRSRRAGRRRRRHAGPARTCADRLHGAWERARGRLPARQAGGEDPAARASGRSLDGDRQLAARPATSPRRPARPTSPRAGPGTAGRRRPAWSRTSTGCRRTTT